MSKNSKTVLWIVVILVVIGVVWWAYAMRMNNNSSLQTGNYDQTSTVLNSTTSTTISSTGTSNADLNRDMSKVDTQMNGLNSDSASADQSLSNP